MLFRSVGATLADPLEGVGYGTCKAKIMRRADGTLWINSFAHGRTTYDLKLDARTADSDDLARVYRFDLAQDSEMISPTITILMSPGA